MTLEKFVDITFKEGEYGTCFRKKIICNDGFNMSVQGSQFHYCSPRKNQNWYNSMEVGFPSEKEELMLEYAENANVPCSTVYGYVPVEIIQQIIDNHGGIDLTKTIIQI